MFLEKQSTRLASQVAKESTRLASQVAKESARLAYSNHAKVLSKLGASKGGQARMKSLRKK
jgi:hypothetical protein